MFVPELQTLAFLNQRRVYLFSLQMTSNAQRFDLFGMIMSQSRMFHHNFALPTQHQLRIFMRNRPIYLWKFPMSKQLSMI